MPGGRRVATGARAAPDHALRRRTAGAAPRRGSFELSCKIKIRSINPVPPIAFPDHCLCAVGRATRGGSSLGKVDHSGTGVENFFLLSCAVRPASSPLPWLLEHRAFRPPIIESFHPG